MLTLTHLSIAREQKTIINNLCVQIEPGSVHAIMGPNGSGKSTLASAIMGHSSLMVNGSLMFNGQEISALAIDQRAKLGIFLACQHPCAIPGVPIRRLLHEAYRAIHGTDEPLAGIDQRIADAAALLSVDQSWLDRCVHDGFSGGEKKRIELLQLMVLRPTLAILDEIDSGLDIDALKIVCDGIAAARMAHSAMSILLITHYPRILHYVAPDHVHVMANGALVASGDASLATRLEQEGYHAFIKI
jgi:Fe-S cluster assembly ATP-binding protein